MAAIASGRPLTETGLKERFFRYFQHEVTGKRFEDYTSCKLMRLVVQLSKNRWVGSKTLPSWVVNEQTLSIIVWQASDGSRTRSRTPQATSLPTINARTAR